jgi:hypothetical protein
MHACVQGSVPPLPVLFTLFGVATSFISTFLSFGLVRQGYPYTCHATKKKEEVLRPS